MASFLHFFSAYGRVKFLNETVNFLQWYRKFRDVLYQRLDKSQASIGNNTKTCDKPGGMLGPVQTSCFCLAELNCHSVRL